MIFHLRRFTDDIVCFTLQRHIYGHQEKNIGIFADDSSLAVNPSYVSSWLKYLSRTPRVAPFLPKNDPLISALKKVYFLIISIKYLNSLNIHASV